MARESFEQSRSVSVTAREEAELTAAGDVGDMLERAPGVVVQRTASGSATPILRGLTGYQVLLMHDDLRLNDALTRAGGSAVLNLIDPESVDAIEVVRGPASVLYGSDALGGVVHVRSLAPALGQPGRSYGLTTYGRAASAERALDGRGALFTGGTRVGARASAGGTYAGELLRGDDLGPQPYTGHRAIRASGSVAVQPARDHRLTLAHQSGHLLDMPRSDVSEPGDVQSTESLRRDATVLTYKARLFARRLRLHAYVGTSLRRELRLRRREAREYERERVRSHQLGVRASTAPWSGASLEFGFESVIDRVASEGERVAEDGQVTRGRGRYVDDSRYDMHALYTLLSQQLARRWRLLLGARGTLVIARAPRDSLREEAQGPRGALDRTFARPVASLGVRANLTDSVAWVASILGGFRAPNLEDFQAFGGGARGYTVPNLRLHEERSWTFESGIELRDRRWDVNVYAFASRLDGLIVRVPTSLNGQAEVDGEPVIGRRNASQSVLLGVELAATHHFDMGLFASAAAWFSWGESERPNDAGVRVTEPASKVPPAIGVLRGGYRHALSPYFGELVLMLQAPQTRLSEGDKSDVRLCPSGSEDCDEVPGFVDLTLRGGVRLREQLTLTLAAENLVNAAYRSYASGAYAPGRNFVAALRTTW